jgi:hypothetical protein
MNYLSIFLQESTAFTGEKNPKIAVIRISDRENHRSTETTLNKEAMKAHIKKCQEILKQMEE